MFERELSEQESSMPDAGEKPSRFRLALDFLKRLLGK
jgi:hypothetical protein